MRQNPTNSKQVDKYLSGLVRDNNSLTFGSYSKIARKLGVSREWVRVQAKKLNIKLTLNSVLKVCPVCQRSFLTRNKLRVFCSIRCKKVHTFYRSHRLNRCEICGLGIIQRTAEMARNKSGRFYCSHKCYGKSKTLRNHGKRLREIYGPDYFYRLSTLGNKKTQLQRHYEWNK